MEKLPASLHYLNLSYNQIRTWNTPFPQQLTTLILSYNVLEQIESSLPSSLVTLECDNNALKRLDLSCAVKLTTLHCRNNPLLTIECVPQSVIELKHDCSPFVDVTYSSDDHQTSKKQQTVSFRKKQFDHRVCLLRYFELKSKFDEECQRGRRETFERVLLRSGKAAAVNAARRLQKHCVNCRGTGGTVFERVSGHYRARCGNRERPCDLQIDLFMGDGYSLSTLLEEFGEHVEEMKETILRQKMDTLFGFLDKEQSSELFAKHKKEFTELTENQKEFQQQVDQRWNRRVDLQRLEQLYALRQSVKRNLDQWHAKGLREHLSAAMVEHVKHLLPLSLELQRIRYPEMLVERGGENDHDVLVQRGVLIDQDTVYLGEGPRVIVFPENLAKMLHSL
jgi:hypothetical protein